MYLIFVIMQNGTKNLMDLTQASMWDQKNWLQMHNQKEYIGIQVEALKFHSISYSLFRDFHGGFFLFFFF